MGNFTYSPDAAIVATNTGKVRGYICNDIYVFKGIPYAKAKRFHAPEPVEPWEKPFDATSFGYVCPLMDIDQPRGELLVPHRFWPMDENCLNLNVWTPALDDKKRPVLVWLHGGGFSAGSAIEHIAYEGENMARYGDVVVVSINHRLNILGYLDLSDFGEEYENSGNAGGDDIIASLKWVHENIAGFGGDPENVTVFGQSGGGAKVTTLLQSPEADGLFAKGFNMSGVIGPVLADADGSGKELVLALMEELGFTDVKELETVPYTQLAAAYKKVSPALRAAGKNVGCTPHPNKHYAGDPLKVGFRRETAHIPLLVGSVFGEFASFMPFAYDRSLSGEAAKEIIAKNYGEDAAQKLPALFAAAYPERPLLDIINLDSIFRGPEIQYVKARSALNDCTYSYLFNQDMPLDGGRTPWHCSDIPFVFHNTCFTPYTTIPGITEKLEKQIFESVIAFARTGNPNNPSVPEWKADTPEEETVMVFDENTRPLVNYDHELIPLLSEVQIAAFMRRRQNTGEDEDLNIQH